MPADNTLALRQAVVTHLRAASPVVAIVSQRSYGEVVPADADWPFTKYGYDTLAPFDATCISGGTVDVTIHTYAKGKSTDVLKQLNKAVIESLDDAQLELDDGWCLDLSFVRAQTMPDGADGFHGIINFSALTCRED